MARSTGRSLFAAALAALFDETELFTRAEWARVLGVTEPAISQWVNDRTIPRPELLALVIDALATSSGVPAEPLDRFRNIARRPSAEVSPHGSRLGPTVAEYMSRSGMETLGRALREHTNPADLRTILEEGSLPVLRREAGSGDALRLWRPSPDLPPRAMDVTVAPDLLWRAPDSSRPRRVPLTDCLTRDRILLDGHFGSGKSTVLWSLALRAAGERFVFGPGDGPNLQGNAPAWESLERLGPDDVLCFDGLDEFPSDLRAKAADEILSVAKRTRARIVVAARPIPELEAFADFQRYEPALLTDTQILRSLQMEAGKSPDPQVDVEKFLSDLMERRELVGTLRRPICLTHAWSSYRRHAITPFAEAETLQECLSAVLESVYFREPWASPRSLRHALAEIAYQSALSDHNEFSTKDCEQWLTCVPGTVPARALLQLVTEQTGLIQNIAPDSWRFHDEIMATHLAAVHVVDSSRDARELVKAWPEHPRLQGVLRASCGVTNDASGLLEFVVNSPEAGAVKATLLAAILGQRLVATTEVLELASDAIATWLEEVLKQWALESVDASGPDFRWVLSARRRHGRADADDDAKTWQTLESLHRARSGFALAPLNERLRASSEPIVAALGDSLSIDGMFKVRTDREASSEILRATVGSPELS